MEHNKLFSIDMVRCPLCHEQMSITKNSLVCNKKHCYDIAKTGYVNFYMRKDKIYTDSLFQSRKNIYEAHFYDQLVDKINEIIEEIYGSNSIVIVDAGCGEGFFTNRIGKSKNAIKIGFDISKEAIKLASKKTHAISWMVADLNNIPVKDKCVDIVFKYFITCKL